MLATSLSSILLSLFSFFFFFFNDPSTTEIYTLSLHDALPISRATEVRSSAKTPSIASVVQSVSLNLGLQVRSEEHTSELQSPMYLVCRLLLEKKNKHTVTD